MYVIEPRTSDIHYQVGKPVLPYCKQAIGSFSIDDGYDSEIVTFKMT